MKKTSRNMDVSAVIIAAGVLLLVALIVPICYAETSELYRLAAATSKSTTMTREKQFDDTLCRQSIAFEEQRRSRIDCARKCAKDDACESVTYIRHPDATSSSGGSCRGYSINVTSCNDFQPSVVGSRTFIVTAGQQEWLEKPCASDADCPAVKTSCFAGVCLCTPGYVYSLSQKLCKDGCEASQWQPAYMAYPGGGMTDNNLQWVTLDYQACRDWCNTYPGCVHIEYQSSNQDCILGGATALQKPNNWAAGYGGWVFYQRTCL